MQKTLFLPFPKIVKTLVFLFFLLLGNSLLKAQEVEYSPINTDRPGICDTPDLIEKGLFQIETGYFFFQDEPNSSDKIKKQYLPSTLLKYSFSDKFVLRLGVDALNLKTKIGDENTSQSGFAPLTFGFKVPLIAAKGAMPKVSVITKINIPGTGSSSFDTDAANPQVKLLMLNNLSEKTYLYYNLSMDFGRGENRNIFGYSVALGRTVFDKMYLFGEVYGYFQGNGDDYHLLDGGITYAVSTRFQVDATAGIAISDISEDFYVGFGAAWNVRLKK